MLGERRLKSNPIRRETWTEIVICEEAAAKKIRPMANHWPGEDDPELLLGASRAGGAGRAAVGATLHPAGRRALGLATARATGNQGGGTHERRAEGEEFCDFHCWFFVLFAAFAPNHTIGLARH
jgi:hypothetical protein